ncbi:MAG: HIT family protein [Alphaproteobacteria bacterium]|nr:HIT family protein [Alphaproteobacteria bacterium]
MSSSEFLLDPRLANDTAFVCDWALSRVLLMNDTRYPWLVLVPRRAGAVEAFDLSPADQALQWREVAHAGLLLKGASGCRKVNVGALGNIVSQLHIHIVARNDGDFAWPGPVWGKGEAVRFDAVALSAEVARWRGLLRPPAD